MMKNMITSSTKIIIWCFLFSAAAVLVTPPFASDAAASPLAENTRTLEVRLNYRTDSEIDLSSEQFDPGKAGADENGAFNVIRNRGEIRSFVTISDSAIVAGTFGIKTVAFRDPETSPERAGHSSKFRKIFSECEKNGIFSGIMNAVDFDGSAFYIGTASGDIVEVGENRARRISIVRSRGRFGITGIRKEKEALLICTDGGGLYVYNGRTVFALSEASNAIASDSVRDASIFSSGDSRYLAVATMRGFSVLKVNNVETNDYESVKSVKTEGAVETLMFAEGKLFAGGIFGIISLDMADLSFKKFPAFRDTYVKTIFGDGRAEKIYAATYVSGVFEFSPDGARRNKVFAASLLKGHGGESHGIRSAQKSGDDFLVADVRGLTRITRGGVFRFPVAEDGPSDRISCSAVHNGRLYFGTFDGGVFSRKDPGAPESLRLQPGIKLSSPHINALASFGGYLLVGSSNGLDAVSPDGTIAPLKGKLSDRHVNCITVSDNRAFVGTSNGITVVSQDLVCEEIKFDPSKIDKHVYSLHHDPAGNTLYIGTYRGFGIFSLSERALFVCMMINSGLPDNWITSIYPFGRNLIIGTYDKGCAVFDPEKRTFSKPPGKNPYPSRMINSNAIFSENDYILIGTYNGGFSVIDARNAASWKARHFNMRNGISGDCVTCFAVHGGKIYAGTHGGITSFDISKFPAFFERYAN